MSDNKSASEKLAERMARLKKLHIARNEARTQNHQEVLKEDERKTLPANFEARQKQAEWLINDKKMREAAAEKGVEYDRIKMLNVSAAEADKLDKMRKRKKNPDAGFSDYESR
jgi:pre-mRNA-splicing factor SYF2